MLNLLVRKGQSVPMRKWKRWTTSDRTSEWGEVANEERSSHGENFVGARRGYTTSKRGRTKGSNKEKFSRRKRQHALKNITPARSIEPPRQDWRLCLLEEDLLCVKCQVLQDASSEESVMCLPPALGWLFGFMLWWILVFLFYLWLSAGCVGQSVRGVPISTHLDIELYSEKLNLEKILSVRITIDLFLY